MVIEQEVAAAQLALVTSGRQRAGRTTTRRRRERTTTSRRRLARSRPRRHGWRGAGRCQSPAPHRAAPWCRSAGGGRSVLRGVFDDDLGLRAAAAAVRATRGIRSPRKCDRRRRASGRRVPAAAPAGPSAASAARSLVKLRRPRTFPSRPLAPIARISTTWTIERLASTGRRPRAACGCSGRWPPAETTTIIATAGSRRPQSLARPR